MVDPTTAYDVVFSHIASHGYTVVAPHKYSLPTSQYDAEWLVKIDQWVQTHLVQDLINDFGFDPYFSIDVNTTFLLGHSSGAHIITNFMKLGCRNVKGISMWSPVDGVDPFGLWEDFCITPGEKLNFETPILLLTAGLDGIPGISNTGGIVPACAPDELSNLRFWDAFNGRAWLNNATVYGHTDFFDPGAINNVIEVTFLKF